MHAAAIDALISLIYEAAIDSRCWQRILEQLVADVPGCSAALFIRRGRPERDNFLQAGYPRGAMDDFVSKHAAQYPWSEIERTVQVGVPYATEDIVPLDSMTYSRFYRTWLQPLGFGAAFGVKLADWPDGHGILVLTCALDVAVAQRTMVLALLGQLAPHMRRSIEIFRHVKDANEEGLRAGVTRTADPSAIVDGTGTVVSMNAAMERITVMGICSLTPGRRLRLYMPEDLTRLTRILSEAAQSQHRGSWPHFMSFEVPARTGPNILEIEPLERRQAPSAGLDRGADLFGARAKQDAFVMTMRVRSLMRGPSVDHIRVGFGLTPKQAEAVWSLVNGDSIEKQARDRGLSIDGVRWHFKNIYQRTGCSSQAELVRLVVSLFGPIA